MESDASFRKSNEASLSTDITELQKPDEFEGIEDTQYDSTLFSLTPLTKLENISHPFTDPGSTLKTNSSYQNPSQAALVTHEVQSTHSRVARPTYRLYKQRYLGVLAILLLNIGAGMSYPWFGPIANNVVAQFPGITLQEVNWLGNISFLMGVIAPSLSAVLNRKFGLRVSYFLGSILLIFGSWIRYAATATSVSSRGAYALLFFGQFFSATAQAIFQTLGPTFSETWFDLNGRTTATMIMSIAAPVGGAIGQLLSPLSGSTRHSILVLAIISTAVTPTSFLIGHAPPIPPSYSGSKPSPPVQTTIKAILGMLPQPHPREVAEGTDNRLDNVSSESYMTPRERLDFAIEFGVFGVLVGAINGFSILSSQLLSPYGYSDDTSGLMGAALLISGIVAAIITSPILDRVLTNHLAFFARLFAPIVALGWFSLIWAVRPNNTGALYAVFVIIGVFSVSLLPVSLELAVELTRDAATSSAILWSASNVFSIMFVEVNSALAEGSIANPPYNMHRSLIFQGALVLVVTSCIFALRGKQVRRQQDVARVNEPREIVPMESVEPTAA